MNRSVPPRALAIPALILACALGGALGGLAPASPLAADTATVTLTRQDCQSLALHVPDLGVTYRPGLDVRGRAVAPADLGGAPQIAVPETIEIPIEIDLQDRFGLPAKEDAFEADAQLGVVQVHSDGRAYFNGQPLQDEAQFELARRCQEILRGQP